MKMKKILTTLVAVMLTGTVGSTVLNVNAEEENYEIHPLGCIEENEEDIAQCPIYDSDYDDMLTAYELPSKVDLTSKVPTPRNQGSQGSCTAFAVAYALKTQEENQEFGWGMSSIVTQFSPAFVYNQINKGVDKGSSITTALTFIKENGVCSWKDMPYDDGDYITQPNSYQVERASNFKISEYSKVTGQDNMKQALSDGQPIVIGMKVYPDFDKLTLSNPIYDNVYGTLRGHHAICIIGYDDSMQAYKIINSWGTDWGLNGYGYISYNLVNGSEMVTDEYGYVATDATQHYKTNPICVKANTELGIFSDTALKNKVGTLSADESIGVTSLIAASNGNPPALKVEGGYITSKTSATTAVKSFNIQYKANGATGTMNNSIIPYGVSTKIRKNTFTKTGYSFAGWYVYRTSDQKWMYYNKETGTKGAYVEGTEPDGYEKMMYRDAQRVSGTSSVNNDTVILYANWIPNTYTVVYNSNGGSGSMDDTTITYGILTNITANNFKKTGYTFRGWYAHRNFDNKWVYRNSSTGDKGWYCEGEQPSGFTKFAYADMAGISRSTPEDKDIVTLYAQWKKA